MDVRQLTVFLAVADDGSFTGAAARLHLVQSGVSATILGLERELDCALFDRSSRRVALTSAGEALLPRAREALRAVDAAREAVASGEMRGSIRIGMAAVPLEPIGLPAILGGFRREHPAVDLTLVSTTRGTGGLVSAVRDGDLDLALVTAPASVAVDAHLLASLRLHVVVSDRHGLASRKRIALAELATEDFVDTPPEWGSREVTDRAFAAAGLHRRVAYQIGDPRIIVDCVREGLGVAVMPMPADRDRAGVHVLTISGDPLLLPLSVLVPPQGRLGAAARDLLDRLLADR